MDELAQASAASNKYDFNTAIIKVAPGSIPDVARGYE